LFAFCKILFIAENGPLKMILKEGCASLFYCNVLKWYQGMPFLPFHTRLSTGGGNRGIFYFNLITFISPYDVARGGHKMFQGSVLVFWESPAAKRMNELKYWPRSAGPDRNREGPRCGRKSAICYSVAEARGSRHKGLWP